jgi:hypothetical protein
MISADIQALFDSIVVRHGGTDNLTRLDLEAVAAIVKMMIELRNASAAEVPRIATGIVELMERLPAPPEKQMVDPSIDLQAELKAKFTQLEVELATLKAEHSTLLRLHLAHMDDPVNATDPKIAMLKATLENREQQIAVLDKLVADLDAKLATTETGQ